LAAALEAARAGADLIACAVYPVALALHRVSGESLAEALSGLGLDTGVDVPALWQASDLIDEHIGDEPVTPLAPRIAVRAAEYDLPAGLVAALDAHLRGQSAGDRLDEVLDELVRVRTEIGSPPLAAPIGQILGSQALLNVLASARYATVVDEVRALFDGRWGTPPGPVDANVRRAISLLTDPDSTEEPPPKLHELRAQAEGLASSEEELLLLGLFGDEAEPLLHAIRGRARGDETIESSVDKARAERIKEIVRVVQETGVGEVTIEEDGLRVTVRRTPEPSEGSTVVPSAPEEPAELPIPQPANGLIRVEAPMVGVFYRSPEPNAQPFVEVGDTVAAGQTLCLLEAMKLFNELKADASGIVRSIHAENAQAVEFGQLLFELEPVGGVPLDAL
jgi:oxaloacetate decarboxylase alpha subunit